MKVYVVCYVDGEINKIISIHSDKDEAKSAVLAKEESEMYIIEEHEVQ